MKIAEAQRGEKSHRWGQTLSDEHKAKLALVNKGKKLSKEHIEKICLAKAALVPCVEQLNSLGKKIGLFDSASDASRKTGVERRNICSVCCGKRQQAGGYRWRYAQ
jgi:hypothetical protein